MLEEMNKMNEENASIRAERNALAARIKLNEAAEKGRPIARSARKKLLAHVFVLPCGALDNYEKIAPYFTLLLITPADNKTKRPAQATYVR